MKVRTSWEHYPNQDIATIHADVKFWDSIHAETHDVPLTADQSRLSDDMLSIHGVVDVAFEQHEIRVTKGRVFAWDEVKPRVESVLSEWCGAEIATPSEAASSE